MSRLLKEKKPIVFLEIHGPHSAKACQNVLASADYFIHRMEAGYAKVEELGELSWKALVLGLPAARS